MSSDSILVIRNKGKMKILSWIKLKAKKRNILNVQPIAVSYTVKQINYNKVSSAVKAAVAFWVGTWVWGKF